MLGVKKLLLLSESAYAPLRRRAAGGGLITVLSPWLAPLVTVTGTPPALLLFIARSNSASSSKSAIEAVRRKLGVRDGGTRELTDMSSAACLGMYVEGVANDDWRDKLVAISGIASNGGMKVVEAEPSELDERTDEDLCKDPDGDAERSVTARVGAREITANTSLQSPLVTCHAV